MKRYYPTFLLGLPLVLVGAAWASGLLTVTRPVWLLALASLPALAWIARFSQAGLPRPVMRIALTLRVCLVLAVVLSLADVHWARRHDTLSTLFLADHSASIPEHIRQQQLTYVNGALKTRTREDRSGLIVFGENASVDVIPGQHTHLGDVRSEVSPHYTNLEHAIGLAVGSFPSDTKRKIVLMTDGNENVGDLMESVRQAAGLGIQVDVLPVTYGYRHEVAIAGLRLPERIAVREPFDMRVHVESTTANRGVLSVYRDGVPIANRQVELVAGDNTFSLSDEVEGAGFHTYSIRISPEQDTLPQNNQASGHVYVQGQARVLFVAEAQEDVHFLLQTCKRQDLETEVVSPQAAPSTLADLQTYDCLILANVSAEHFSQPQMEAMRAAVRDLGIGLMMIGGERAFGMGDYRKTPIEEALPVEMDPENKKILPNGALILAIDISGSMTGDKLEQAKPAAWAAVEVLAERDQVGVIAFDDQAHWLVPPTSAQDKQAIRLAIEGLGPGGGTDIMSALNEAHRAIAPLDAAVKHIIILSDGQSGHHGFEETMAAIVQDGVTVTTIGIGERDGQPLMRAIAERGGGRFHYVRDPHLLPRVFTKEAKVVRRSLIFNQPFRPLLAAKSELTRGLQPEALPELMAYVATSAKPRAVVPLVSSNENRDPILAGWQFGLGRSLAFTSDASARWGRHWVGWHQFDRFWGQAIRWTARQREAGHLQLSTSLDGRQGRLVIEAVDDAGDYLNFMELEGRLVDPDHNGHGLDIRQSGPGRYEATFEVQEHGVNLLNISYRDPVTGNQGFVTAGVSIPYPPEYQALETNHALLRQAAELGGGRLLTGDPEVDQVFEDDLPGVRSSTPAWQLLAGLAILVFLLDVVTRRVMLSRRELEQGWERLRQSSEAEDDPVMTRLRARRRQVNQDLAKVHHEAEPAAAVPRESLPQQATAPRPAAKVSTGEPESYTSRLKAAKQRARPHDSDR